MSFYNVSLIDLDKRIKVTEFSKDIGKGLDMIIDSLQTIISNPEKVKLDEIESMRGFCTTLCDYELSKRAEDHYPIYLAA